jgi:hypothetical protein
MCIYKIDFPKQGFSLAKGGRFSGCVVQNIDSQSLHLGGFIRNNSRGSTTVFTYMVI